jgi:hypothetical protein
MPLFALPLPTNSSAPLPRPNFSSLPRRKRKRASSDSSSNDKSSPEPESDRNLASTNPLSLTPAEIAQYRLAGLELNEELPGQGVDGVKDFPHRAIPAQPSPEAARETRKRDKGKGKETAPEDGDDTDAQIRDENPEQRGRGPGLHLRHLSVLTTILHRCLLDGDIPRATLAWSILIREQFWGQPIDIRGSGYWAIGAELLTRSGDRRARDDSESSGDEQPQGEGARRGEKRWGSAEGWEKAKAYYEQLILQYPYRRQFQRSTSAIDFWPAMLGCEIYGIQWEEKEGLRKLEVEEGDDLEDEGDENDDIEGDGNAEEDSGFAANHQRIARRLRKRDDRIWQAKEDIRWTALRASEAVAGRIDNLMSNHPYMDSRILLRLRAMLALYIGDLSVPSLPAQSEEEPEERYRLRNSRKEGQDALQIRQRQAEHARAKEKRGEQRALAQGLFDKIMKKGGWVGDISHLGLDEEDIAGESQHHDYEV